MQLPNSCTISLCCTKKKESAYGFKWKYYKGPPTTFEGDDATTGFTPVEELLRIKQEAVGDSGGHYKHFLARPVEQICPNTGNILRM